MNDKTKNNLKYGLGSIVFVIVFFAIFIIPKVIKSNKIFNTLHKDGLITNAIVVKNFVKRSSSNTYYMVTCKYFVDGLIYYTKDRAMKKYIYEVGDTLALVYSKNDPNTHRIIDIYSSDDMELWDNVTSRLVKNDSTEYLKQFISP
jgi:hypothetical protein